MGCDYPSGREVVPLGGPPRQRRPAGGIVTLADAALGASAAGEGVGPADSRFDRAGLGPSHFQIAPSRSMASEKVRPTRAGASLPAAAWARDGSLIVPPLMASPDGDRSEAHSRGV